MCKEANYHGKDFFPNLIGGSIDDFLKNTTFQPEKLSFKKEFYGDVELESEDDGKTLVSNIYHDEEGSDAGMYIQLCSWSTKTHTDIKKFENRRVKVTVETID